jgi:hypothetical protein
MIASVPIAGIVGVVAAGIRALSIRVGQRAVALDLIAPVGVARYAVQIVPVGVARLSRREVLTRILRHQVKR